MVHFPFKPSFKGELENQRLENAYKRCTSLKDEDFESEFDEEKAKRYNRLIIELSDAKDDFISCQDNESAGFAQDMAEKLNKLWIDVVKKPVNDNWSKMVMSLHTFINITKGELADFSIVYGKDASNEKAIMQELLDGSNNTYRKGDVISFIFVGDNTGNYPEIPLNQHIQVKPVNRSVDDILHDGIENVSEFLVELSSDLKKDERVFNISKLAILVNSQAKSAGEIYRHEPYLGLGFISFQNRQYDQAMNDFYKGLMDSMSRFGELNRFYAGLGDGEKQRWKDFNYKKRLGVIQEIAASFEGLGDCCVRTGHPDKSEEFYNASIKILKEISTQPKPIKAFVAVVRKQQDVCLNIMSNSQSEAVKKEYIEKLRQLNILIS